MIKKPISNLLYKLVFALFILLTTSCETLNQASEIISKSGLINPTSAEIGLGLKQALEIGTNLSADKLASKDGYLGNLAIKLLFPPEAQKVEKTLRSLGLNSLTDNVILSINRAAEDAALEAKPVFIAAITQMTIADAINIIRGPKDGATNYFREKTTVALVEAFSPVVKNSLDKVEATKYYGDVINTYNAFPTTRNKINPDLTSYVVGKAVDALFDQIAKEELEIRENPLKRTTEILKKVFGAVWY